LTICSTRIKKGFQFGKTPEKGNLQTGKLAPDPDVGNFVSPFKKVEHVKMFEAIELKARRE
jgi:hypothetical protein